MPMLRPKPQVALDPQFEAVDVRRFAERRADFRECYVERRAARGLDRDDNAAKAVTIALLGAGTAT